MKSSGVNRVFCLGRFGLGLAIRFGLKRDAFENRRLSGAILADKEGDLGMEIQPVPERLHAGEFKWKPLVRSAIRFDVIYKRHQRKCAVHGQFQWTCADYRHWP